MLWSWSGLEYGNSYAVMRLKDLRDLGAGGRDRIDDAKS